ncbi:MAG: TlpA family protein disulfide reductase [Cyclobacteriaceae bacterium]
MKRIALLCILAVSDSFGQSAVESVYDWDFVMSRVRKNAMNASAATNQIINEIAASYGARDEQKELIKFYRGAYDFKIVDKAILKSLIDSLSQHGVNEEIKANALEARQAVEYRLLNKKIRDLNFADKTGKYVSLASLSDKIVVIELWATWCAPCVKEMVKIPVLREANPNVEFYSISLDKSSETMKRFVDKKKFDWPIVFGGDEKLNKELWEYFNIVAIPKYYTVNRDGIVIHVADTLDETFIKSLK